MGVTKTAHFTAKQIKLSNMAKALGHPARMAILEHLLKSPSCICNDLVNELPLAQPTISQHLKELKNAGWIKGSIEGNAICYCIDQKALHAFQNYLASLNEKLSLIQTNCC
ncbi:MAG: metalloregulator ArsR/SmtB family transcription factor [Bacteroidia bacterium]|jgi:DNA-binding transcriptional ArsR family regulator